MNINYLYYMKAEKNKVVVLSYELEAEGKVVDSATPQNPFDYIHGTKTIIPKLEETLEGLEEGAEFVCSIAPGDAYGEYDLKKVFDIPKDTFVINGELREDLLKVGAYIPLLNSAGDVCQAMVMEVKESSVTMDFNPPMAGKTLNFKGKVLSVRDATPKELLEGLHGEFLPEEECGCCGHHHHHGEGECHHGHGEGCHGHGHGHGGHCHHDHEEGGCCHEHEEGCCHGHGDGDGCCHS